jgi:hypothetical protein
MLEEIKIEKAENGYILSWYEDDGQDGVKDTCMVFQYDDDTKPVESELKAFQLLVYNLMDVLAVPDSKHNPYRLKININQNEDL